MSPQAKETDNLVPASGQGDLEMTTLLSEMPGHSTPSREEVESRPSEARPHPHPYHMKNKYTFRSDSVYSDVVPMSAASNSNNKVSGKCLPCPQIWECNSTVEFRSAYFNDYSLPVSGCQSKTKEKFSCSIVV
jgi:hypothetical protein